MENKVANNTLILYFRMLLTMCISIYTSRVVLQTLGINDYGIYNVVGGVVALFNFFNNALSSSFQRYFCLEINKNDEKSFSNVIGVSFSVITIWVVLIVVVSEIFGLWLINYKLVIPNDRLFTANIIFQFSIMSFIICLFQSIYHALIISFEKMKLFAYISIFEALCKFGVALSITLFSKDYLLNYGLLMLLSSIVIFIVYRYYCFYYFTVSRVGYKYDNIIIKKMFSFSLWTLIGSFSNVIQTNGVNILLNIFFGPAVNAARAISFQIYTAVGTFTRGFQMAFSPTMIKAYGLNQIENVTKQLLTSSKVSLYLMILFALPIFLNTHLILNLWLGKENVPMYTNSFVQLILTIGIIEALSPPIVNLIYANGNIKRFQIFIGLFTILVLPISYLLLKFGMGPLSVYILTVIIVLISHGIRLYFLRKILVYDFLKYLKVIIIPLLVSISLLFFISSFYMLIFSTDNILYYLSVVLVLELISIFIIYNWGIDNHEKKIIKEIIKCVRIFK